MKCYPRQVFRILYFFMFWLYLVWFVNYILHVYLEAPFCSYLKWYYLSLVMIVYVKSTMDHFSVPSCFFYKSIGVLINMKYNVILFFNRCYRAIVDWGRSDLPSCMPRFSNFLQIQSCEGLHYLCLIIIYMNVLYQHLSKHLLLVLFIEPTYLSKV